MPEAMRIAQRHAAEAAAAHVVDAVEQRQALVHVGVARGEQIEDVVVLAEDAVDDSGILRCIPAEDRFEPGR